MLISFIAISNAVVSQTKNNTITNTDTAKIIVMVNTASWCPACKANGERVEKNVISQLMTKSNCEIIVNDLTNEETKTNSKRKCDAAGITEVASNNSGTGMIYFINSKTKEIVSKISVVKSNDEIILEFEKAIKTLI